MIMRYFGGNGGLFAAAAVIELQLPGLRVITTGQSGEALVRRSQLSSRCLIDGPRDRMAVLGPGAWVCGWPANDVRAIRLVRQVPVVFASEQAAVA